MWQLLSACARAGFERHDAAVPPRQLAGRLARFLGQRGRKSWPDEAARRCALCRALARHSGAAALTAATLQFCILQRRRATVRRGRAVLASPRLTVGSGRPQAQTLGPRYVLSCGNVWDGSALLPAHWLPVRRRATFKQGRSALLRAGFMVGSLRAQAHFLGPPLNRWATGTPKRLDRKGSEVPRRAAEPSERQRAEANREQSGLSGAQ